MAGQKKSYWCLTVFWLIFLGFAGYGWFNFWVIYTNNPNYESIGEAVGGVFANVLGSVLVGAIAAIATVIFLILFLIWICLKSKK